MRKSLAASEIINANRIVLYNTSFINLLQIYIYSVGIDKLHLFPLLYYSLISVATSYILLLSAKAYKLLSASSQLNNYTDRLTHRYTSSETVLSSSTNTQPAADKHIDTHQQKHIFKDPCESGW